MQQITVGGNTFTLVSLPSYPGFSDISVTMDDAVAIVQSPYVLSQMQTQRWPGSDMWAAEIMMPPMDQWTAAPWRAFFAACYGALNVFQLGDQGAEQGVENWAGNFANATIQGSIPVVDGSVPTNNAITSNTLFTMGWKPSTFRLLMPGNYFQVGYRLYTVADLTPVNSDSNGKAQISVWPSLRETPPDQTPLVLNKPVGLFRMAANKRNWHTANTRFSSYSFKVVEVR